MRDMERFRDENYQEEQPHGPVESAVGISLSYNFGYRFLQQNLFTESQWQSLRDIFERYFGLRDIDTALKYEIERMHDGLPCNPGLSTYQFDIDDEARRKRAGKEPEEENDVFEDDEDISFDVSRPHRRAQLPAGWLSILEAAYEHQDDTQALLRLAMYAILSDIPPAERYLPMAKALAADDWPNILARITDLFDQYDDRLFPLARNRMMERLIIQEQLSDQAWQYLQARTDIDNSEMAIHVRRIGTGRHAHTCGGHHGEACATVAGCGCRTIENRHCREPHRHREHPQTLHRFRCEGSGGTAAGQASSHVPETSHAATDARRGHGRQLQPVRSAVATRRVNPDEPAPTTSAADTNP